MPPLATPFAGSKFNLYYAGIAGFFGGEEAISAMTTIHFYKGRRWFGWFNSPGSYTIAKHLVSVARSRAWHVGLFPGLDDPLPAVSHGLYDHGGLTHISGSSGMRTFAGHLARLTMNRSKEVEAEEIPGKLTIPFDVAYLAVTPSRKPVHEAPVELLSLKSALSGLVPIVVSVVTCVMCALVYDWYSFYTILVGIISNGCATHLVGKGRLVIKSVQGPPFGIPPSHGILMGEDGVVVIKGEEQGVDIIARGRFNLEHRSNHRTIGICALLFILQFLLQLSLITQGSLFGQVMFLVSLAVSWRYNCHLSPTNEKVQTDILFRALGNPEMLRFRAGTRTTMTVFACLLLFHGVKKSSPEEDREIRVKILNSCLPSNTAVWRRWKEKVVQQLLSIDENFGSLGYLEEDNWEDRAFPEPDRMLLNVLLHDASAAFRGYFRARERLPGNVVHEELSDTYRRGDSDGFIYFRLEEIR